VEIDEEGLGLDVVVEHRRVQVDPMPLTATVFADDRQPESTRSIAIRVRRCLDVVADAATVALRRPWPTSPSLSDEGADGRRRFARGWSTWTEQRIMTGWAYPDEGDGMGAPGWLADDQIAGPMVLRLPDLNVEGRREPGFWER
jgi:hypothetical protein